jgi:putative transposase
MSELYQSLSHSKWDCKYHVVFVPKRRRKAIFGQTRRQLGAIFHSLARQKECQIIEGHLISTLSIRLHSKPLGTSWKTASAGF